MDYGYLTCTGPSIACYDDSDCDDGDSCTTDRGNDAGTSTSSCSHTSIVACTNSDGCCPTNCDATNDNDCGADCGNGVVEGTEECENADLSGCTSPPHGTCDEITCSGSCSCEYNLKCDGSTCAVGSADYNNYCVAPAYFECHVDTSCASGETEIIDLSAKNNSHAEIVGASGGYSQKLCCSNISSVQTTTGTGDCKTTVGPSFTGLVTFSGDTNAQVEKYNLSSGGFDNKKNVCVELTSGSLECSYVPSSACSDIKVVSISSDTNAHTGDKNAYPKVICCSVS